MTYFFPFPPVESWESIYFQVNITITAYSIKSAQKMHNNIILNTLYKVSLIIYTILWKTCMGQMNSKPQLEGALLTQSLVPDKVAAGKELL